MSTDHKSAEAHTAEAPAGSAAAEEVPKMDQASLESALRSQIEFYFSKENISNDAFLVSQMNGNKQVGVNVIARFKKVSKLLAQSEDAGLLVKVMRACKNCEVDEKGELVKPRLKVERNTLILREIPQSTSADLVRGIFDHEECGKVVDLRSDIGDTWFVTFESEDKCMDTCMFLQGREFQGKKIKCRVKQESMLRGFYMHQGAQKTNNGDRWRQAAPPGGYQYASTPVYYNQQFVAMPYGQQQQWQGQQNAGRGGGRASQTRGGAQAGGRGRRAAGKEGSGSSTPQEEGTPRNSRAAKDGKTPKTPKGGKKDGREKKDGKKDGKGGKNKAADKQVEFNKDDFPALSNTDQPAEVIGYAEKFKAYSREDLAEIVAKMTKVGFQRPDTFPSDRPGDEADPGLVVNKAAAQECQLLEPFPVMFPASPSPVLAAQPRATNMPSLDLNVKKKKKRGSVSVNKGNRKSVRGSVNQPKYAQKAKKAGRPRAGSQSANRPSNAAGLPPKASAGVPSGYAGAAAKAAAPKPAAAKPAAAKAEAKPAPAPKAEAKPAPAPKAEAKPAAAKAEPAPAADGKPTFADLLKGKKQ